MKKNCMLLAALAALAAAQAHAAFRCVDTGGVTHVGDTPPAACADVPIYEISRGGSVIRRIDPTPSPEELRERREAAKARREAEKEAAEQHRKDVALLASFSSEKEFDVVRDRNIEPLTGRIQSARDRLADIAAREKRIAEEMEFYTSGKSARDDGKPHAVPAAFTAELERLRQERAVLNGSIARSEQEIREIRTRFDTDKKRWVGLKTGAIAMPKEPRSPTPVRKTY